MRFKSFLAGLVGLFMTGALAAQAPVASGPPALDAENLWHLDLTTGGRVTIQLRPDAAPAHVERIKTLTRQGFYDGLVFHRVIEGFMAQGGDPTGTGQGGSDLPDLAAEFNRLPHVRGAVAMARAADSPDTGNSQFYIMFVPRLPMDGDYTIFGRVVSGMSFVDSIERGEPPLNPTRIVRASIGADNVPALPAETLIAAGRAAAPAAAPAPAEGELALEGAGQIVAVPQAETEAEAETEVEAEAEVETESEAAAPQ